MRIISGTHKGKRLTAPKNLPVRPTTDFAKEGLFNILNNRLYFHELRILDLFAGTGNISYEFASRGSQGIQCVDADYGCVKYIKKTADDLGFPIQAFKADLFQFLNHQGTLFDVVFADPPYAIDPSELSRLVSLVFDNNWLKEDGLLIIEHPKQIDLSEVVYYSDERKYGGSVFSFFERDLEKSDEEE